MIKLRNDKPAYMQIGIHILTRISAGEFEIDDTIGTVRSLSKDYIVTTKTIQKSLDYLEERDVINRKQSSGSYVKINREKALVILKIEAMEITRRYLLELRDIGYEENVEELLREVGDSDKN